MRVPTTFQMLIAKIIERSRPSGGQIYRQIRRLVQSIAVSNRLTSVMAGSLNLATLAEPSRHATLPVF
jgi:hypothetical protein